MTPPQRRPAIGAVSFEEVGEAISYPLLIALPAMRAAETVASGKVAHSPLAWRNGLECDHFPILHLCDFDMWIPTKPPPRSEKIALPCSEMMSLPSDWGLTGTDGCCFVRGRRQHAVALEVQSVSVVDEAVENGISVGRVTKHPEMPRTLIG